MNPTVLSLAQPCTCPAPCTELARLLAEAADTLSQGVEQWAARCQRAAEHVDAALEAQSAATREAVL